MKITDKHDKLYKKACKRESAFRQGIDDYADVEILYAGLNPICKSHCFRIAFQSLERILTDINKCEMLNRTIVHEFQFIGPTS